VNFELKSNGIRDLKRAVTTMLQVAWQLHDKLTFLFKLCHATRPNLWLVAQ